METERQFYVPLAACLTCGKEFHDVPLVATITGLRMRKKCSCGGQLVSNPRAA